MTPPWFSKAISAPSESRYVDVDGATIHYLAWNLADTDKPGLLFAHGFRAHARWWSFVAPFFLSHFRVVALDFAGMGDSSGRADYSEISFSHDIVGVLEHAGLGRSTLVGHSFGGGRVARTCAEFRQFVARAIILDSYLPVPEIEPVASSFELRPKRTYPTYEAARARFRLVPEQGGVPDYIRDYVAHHSLKEVPGGWTWKFDEHLRPRDLDQTPAEVSELLSSLTVPVTYMYGDQSSVVSRPLALAIVEHLSMGHGPVAIPQSHHHVMLDQPLALVAALKAAIY
jgi:pimeloyl-ACP methyl ester carboxylesterase